MKRKRRLVILFSVAGGVAATCIAAFFIYVSIYYHADERAIKAMESDSIVTVSERDGKIVFEPETAQCGIIFYPGAKVEYKVYAPLLHKLAQKNMLCVAVKMPFNLAVLNSDAADGIREQYPEIKRWYIGGSFPWRKYGGFICVAAQ